MNFLLYFNKDDYEENEFKPTEKTELEKQLPSTTEYICDPNAQNFPSLLPRSLQKRHWASNDPQVEKLNNTIILNQRHYASILGRLKFHAFL